MKIALLHLDLSAGPVEQNQRKILWGMEKAAKAEADWIVTPESAIEGYLFKSIDPKAPVSIQPGTVMMPFRNFAESSGCTLFLCCAERDAQTGKLYNSCLVMDKTGKIVARHRKMFSYQSGAEGWLFLGNSADVFIINGIRAGILICADAYFEGPCQKMKDQGAEIILVPAAWPSACCCPDPVAVWRQCAKRCGCPVVIANQTGSHSGLDMNEAQSAVIAGKEGDFFYQGAPGVLLFDYDLTSQLITSTKFQVIHKKEKDQI